MLAPDIDERVAVGRRQRSKRRGPVTLNEKIDIVHRVLIGFEKHADIARELRVAPSVVAMVIYKAKQKKEVLRELLNKREEAASRREAIKAVTEGLNARRVVIDNVQQVLKEVTQGPQIETTDKEVRSVMREELGMRYRKIKTVSLHSNSVKNLVLRQRWSLEFLAQARKKKVFINVDETWLGMSDFRRMKW